MKTYFRKITCPGCSKSIDPIEKVCPHCGHFDSSQRDFHDFDHQVREPWYLQITYFAIGIGVLQILGFIIAAICLMAYRMQNPGITPEELAKWASSPIPNFIVNGTSQLIVFIAFGLLFGLRKKFKILFASFKDWKGYVAGIVGGLALIGITTLYNILIGVLFRAAGMPDPGVNQNETAIRAMVQALPVLSVIVFGLMGPFCEEVTYRIGLFGFSSRLGKALGYILSALVFGMVHFNWSALFSPELRSSLPTEFAALPSYIGSGLALAFLYDRFGLSASYTAHALNNTISVVTTMLAK